MTHLQNTDRRFVLFEFDMSLTGYNGSPHSGNNDTSSFSLCLIKQS